MSIYERLNDLKERGDEISPLDYVVLNCAR